MNEDNKQQELEKSLQKMMMTTHTFDNFQTMMKTTRSFYEEIEYQKEQSRKAIADAFARMINLTQRIEYENERALKRTAKPTDKVTKYLPAKYKHLPLAFKRNPKLVIKYFVGMLLGRVLAIILYIIAAFIPAIPVPESVQGWIGKPIRALGGAVVSMRGFVSDPSTLITAVSSIPTDINKLLQKIGEFFTFYGRRVWAFFVRMVRHPRLAYQDVTTWARENAQFFKRVCRTAAAVTCSFLMIKLAMIFLLPLFGGIAITIMGIKISIVLIVVVRMIVDRIGEIIGTKVFGKLSKIMRN